MKFTVNNGNPSFSNNALKSGNRLATYRQTQQEHKGSRICVDYILPLFTGFSDNLHSKKWYIRPRFLFLFTYCGTGRNKN